MEEQLEEKVIEILSHNQKRERDPRIHVSFEEYIVVGHFIGNMDDKTLEQALEVRDIKDLIIADYFWQNYGEELRRPIIYENDIILHLACKKVSKPCIPSSNTVLNQGNSASAMGYLCLIKHPEAKSLIQDARCVDELKLILYIDQLIDRTGQTELKGSSIKEKSENLAGEIRSRMYNAEPCGDGQEQPIKTYLKTLLRSLQSVKTLGYAAIAAGITLGALKHNEALQEYGTYVWEQARRLPSAAAEMFETHNTGQSESYIQKPEEIKPRLTETQREIIATFREQFKTVQGYYDQGRISVAEREKRRLVDVMNSPFYAEAAYDVLRKEVVRIGR